MDVFPHYYINEMYNFKLDTHSGKVRLTRHLVKLRPSNLRVFSDDIDKLRFNGQIPLYKTPAQHWNSFIHRLCGEPRNVLITYICSLTGQLPIDALEKFDKYFRMHSPFKTSAEYDKYLVGEYKKIIGGPIRKYLDRQMRPDEICHFLDIYQPRMKEYVAELALKRAAPNAVIHVNAALAFSRGIPLPMDAFVLRTLERVITEKNIKSDDINLREIYQWPDLRDSSTYKLLEMMFIANNWSMLLDNGKTIAENVRNYCIKQPESVEMLMSYLLKNRVALLLDDGETCRGICRRYAIAESRYKLKIDAIAFSRVENMLRKKQSCQDIYFRLEFSECFCSYERIEMMAVDMWATPLLQAGMGYDDIRARLAITQSEALYKLEDVAARYAQDIL